MSLLGIIFALCFTLYIIASLVLMLVVLVQSGKGGGLSGLVGAGTAISDHLGATGAEKTLNRWTTYCAVGFLVLNIVLVLLGREVFKPSILDDVPEVTQPAQAAAPVTPGIATDAPAPVQAIPAPDTQAAPPAPAPEAPAPSTDVP